jgi:hypothetical protein
MSGIRFSSSVVTVRHVAVRHVTAVVLRMVGACRVAFRRMVCAPPNVGVTVTRLDQRCCVPSARKLSHLDKPPRASEVLPALSAPTPRQVALARRPCTECGHGTHL